MKWLLTAWQLIRDIALTGLGARLLIVQSQSQHPSDPVIYAALALLLPAAAAHVLALLSSVIGAGQQESSPPSPSSSPSPGSHSGGTGEGDGAGGAH